MISMPSLSKPAWQPRTWRAPALRIGSMRHGVDHPPRYVARLTVLLLAFTLWGCIPYNPQPGQGPYEYDSVP